MPLPAFAVSRGTRSGLHKNRPQEQLVKLSVEIKKEVDELEEQIVSRSNFRPDNANTTKYFNRQDRASTIIKEEYQDLENMHMFDLMERLARR